MAEKKKKDWIKGAIKKPGALRKQLKVKKGKKIPKKKLIAAAKKGHLLTRLGQVDSWRMADFTREEKA